MAGYAFINPALSHPGVKIEVSDDVSLKAPVYQDTEHASFETNYYPLLFS